MPHATKEYGVLTPAVFHILLALANGPLHGYAIMRAVEAAADPGVATGPGTIYGSIGRMMDAGLVRDAAPSELAAEPESSGRGKPRRYYRLTEAGAEALRGEATRLERLAAMARSKGVVTGEASS